MSGREVKMKRIQNTRKTEAGARGEKREMDAIMLGREESRVESHRKGERWTVQVTYYDNHFLNYVLHINKHLISSAVICKAFASALQRKHLTQPELKPPRFIHFAVMSSQWNPTRSCCRSMHLPLGDIPS